MKGTKAERDAKHRAFFEKCKKEVNAGVGLQVHAAMARWHRYAGQNPGAYAALGYREPVTQ